MGNISPFSFVGLRQGLVVSEKTSQKAPQRSSAVIRGRTAVSFRPRLLSRVLLWGRHCRWILSGRISWRVRHCGTFYPAGRTAFQILDVCKASFVTDQTKRPPGGKTV